MEGLENVIMCNCGVFSALVGDFFEVIQLELKFFEPEGTYF